MIDAVSLAWLLFALGCWIAGGVIAWREGRA
jgi:hypothetical protein